MSDASSWAGVIISIGAFAMSIAAYRRAGALKSTDLRIEVRTLANTLRSAIAALPALLDLAHESRMRVLAATAGALSGDAKLWEEQVAANRSLLAKLAAPTEQNYAKHTHQALEDELVALRGLRDQVDATRERYLSALAADEKERGRLKNAVAAIVPRSN